MGRPPQCDACCPVTTSTTTTTLFPPTTPPPPPPPPPPPECPDGFFQCRYEYSNGSWASVWEANRNPNCECTCPSTSSVQGDWFSQNSEDPVDGQCADVTVPCCSPDCYSYVTSFNNVCFGTTTTTTTEGPTATTTGSPTTTTTPSPRAVVYCKSTCDENAQNSCFGGTFDLPASFNPSDCQDFTNLSDASRFYNDLLTSTRAVILTGDCNSSFATVMKNSLCSDCPDTPCTTTTTSAPTTTTTTAAPTTTTTSGPTTTTTGGPTTTTTSGPTTTTTSGPTLPPTTTTTTTIKPFACIICPADFPICLPVDDCSECNEGQTCITNCNLEELPSDFTCWATSAPDAGGNDPGDNPDEDANPTPV